MGSQALGYPMRAGGAAVGLGFCPSGTPDLLPKRPKAACMGRTAGRACAAGRPEAQGSSQFIVVNSNKTGKLALAVRLIVSTADCDFSCCETGQRQDKALCQADHDRLRRSRNSSTWSVTRAGCPPLSKSTELCHLRVAPVSHAISGQPDVIRNPGCHPELESAPAAHALSLLQRTTCLAMITGDGLAQVSRRSARQVFRALRG